MADYPRFFSKNYVQPSIVDFQKDYSNIPVTGGDDTRKFLVDRNKNSQWNSGATQDASYQIDSFDADPLEWTAAQGGVTLTRDTTIKHEGTASLKLETGTISSGLLAYKNFDTPIDISQGEKVKIWWMSNLSSLNLANLQLLFDADADCVSPDKVLSFSNVGTVDTWEEFQWTTDLSGLSSVKSIGLKDSSGLLDNFTLHFDDLRITKEPDTVEVQFYEGSNPIDRTVNTLCLENINLKEFKLQYEDSGGSWADVSGMSWTTNTETFLFEEFSDITTGRMRLIIYKTMTQNDNKKIGEFWLMKNLYDLTDAMDTYSPSTLQDDGFVRLATFEDSLWWLHEKYKATVGLKRITLTELNELKTIYDYHEPFVWIPEPELRPDKFYLVTWKSPWSEPYSSQYKGLGYDVRFNLEEV